MFNITFWITKDLGTAGRPHTSIITDEKFIIVILSGDKQNLCILSLVRIKKNVVSLWLINADVSSMFDMIESKNSCKYSCACKISVRMVLVPIVLVGISIQYHWIWTMDQYLDARNWWIDNLRKNRVNIFCCKFCWQHIRALVWLIDQSFSYQGVSLRPVSLPYLVGSAYNVTPSLSLSLAITFNLSKFLGSV